MLNISTPLVSVIIPTYNRADMLSTAIESAINQTYPNKQIIVVDDGSVDNTRELVAQYPQVEYVYQTNGGQGKARNTGLKLAKGEYIASLDSDDIWNDNFIERCIEKLEKDNLGFVFANWTMIINDNISYDFFVESTILNHYMPAKNTDPWILLNNETLRHIYLRMCPATSSSLIFKRQPNLGWTENLNIGDDWCLQLDMILVNGYDTAFTTDRLWTKRIAGQNLYEGKEDIEILEFLYIQDVSAILERHRPNLRDYEIAFLEEEIYINIYKVFIYKLQKLKLTPNDNLMFRKAFRARPFLFIKACVVLVYIWLKKIAKKIIYGVSKLSKILNKK